MDERMTEVRKIIKQFQEEVKKDWDEIVENPESEIAIDFFTWLYMGLRLSDTQMGKLQEIINEEIESYKKARLQ